jgi:hypothetical protein
MNNATPKTAAQQAIPATAQPMPGYLAEPQNQAVPANGERNPAQTDDSPDAILGYN